MANKKGKPRKRARNEEGKFVGDNPFTEANEAWVDGKKSIFDLVKEFIGTRKRKPFFKWLTDK
jgi:hypothetical protein